MLVTSVTYNNFLMVSNSIVSCFSLTTEINQSNVLHLKRQAHVYHLRFVWSLRVSEVERALPPISMLPNSEADQMLANFVLQGVKRESWRGIDLWVLTWIWIHLILLIITTMQGVPGTRVRSLSIYAANLQVQALCRQKPQQLMLIPPSLETMIRQ